MAHAPNPDEAAAIAAAIQRFVDETAPAPAAGGERIGPWQRAALVEGVERKPTIPQDPGGGNRWQS